jgi:hypothetical protein
MSKDSNEGTQRPTGKSPASVLFLSIADTTWRMFVPTIGCLLLGRLADGSWNTKPYGMMIGIIVGVSISGYLIKQQLDKEV